MLQNDSITHALTTLAQLGKKAVKMASVLAFATGIGMTIDQQQNVMDIITGGQCVLRKAFVTNLKSQVKCVRIGSTRFGDASDAFNRIAMPKLEHILADAVATAFPWADGYTFGTCASTWHRDQMYPSEVCLFRCANIVELHGHMPGFDTISEHVKNNMDSIEPFECIPAKTKHVGRMLDNIATSVAVTSQSDSDVCIAEDMEVLSSALTMDNPLLNNAAREKC
jgi:hypothetical protein